MSRPDAQWQPLKTAPDVEGGMVALVYSPRFGIQMGTIYVVAGERVVHVPMFHGDWGVTHWRQLPAPPDAQREGE